MGKVKLETIVKGLFIGGFSVTFGAVAKLMGDGESPLLYTGLISAGASSMIFPSLYYVLKENKNRTSSQNNSEIYSQ